MKLLICSLVCTFGVMGTSLAAEASLNQRVEIQPGGWVRIDPAVATDVYCIGSANEVTKICRCDFDTENKFRAELVLVANNQTDKVVALTPYYYSTYESCQRELNTFAVCTKKEL
jgi:hypothetical protein